MDINLNLLKYFYEVVREKNITKAAEKVYITQPAMTRAIKDLENQLNTKLLERTQKGVIPTNEGMILYNHIENIFNEINVTKNILESSNIEKDFYIGITTSNYFKLIIDLLKEFNKKFENIRVHIIFENINVIDDLRKSGKLDIVIKNKNEALNDFKKIDDFELENFFIASRKYYPELDNTKIDLKELLKKYPLIIMSEVSPGRRNFNSFLKDKGISIKPQYEFNSYDLCKKLVEAGIDIGVDNSYNFESENYIYIDTEKMPKRYFEIGYINSSNNKYIKDFIDIYIIKRLNSLFKFFYNNSFLETLLF